MAKTQVLKCDMVSVEEINLLLTAGIISVAGAFTSGALRKTADTWGLVFDDYIAGETAVLFTRAPRAIIPKTAGGAIVKGDTLWLNETTKTVSATDGGSDVDVGMAYLDAESADTEVIGSFRGF